MNNKNNLLKVLFVIFFCGLIPMHFVNAAKIFVNQPQNQIRVGDTVLIRIMLDTEDKEINAIDGKIIVQGSAKVSFVNVAGSIFSLWPNKPSISGDEISFVGGTPSGVFGNNLRLFEIAISPSKTGNITISTDKDSVILLNDGLGTKLAISPSSQIITIGAENGESRNEIANLILFDKNPPEPFKVELGKDIKSYNNQYFINFYTTDKESGIHRYEIIEGENPIIRSGNPYILRDQTLKTDVVVRAVDNAGNVREETFKAPKKFNILNWLVLIIAIIIIALLFFVKFKKR